MEETTGPCDKPAVAARQDFAAARHRSSYMGATGT
jgi:hypothetical protein